ncbi:F-box protein At5g49610-like [Silene latifolia]|uniref:F-box protein At5g49610-like n=1 Tax=Silene latifolia TaxID=37657 RepID=UPI003D788C5B
MARPQKTQKINHGGNSTTMEDLDDYMLTQILLRLPSCATVLACSLVNKRWCSLISDPNFPVQFTNHKKRTTTYLKDLPWTFIATIRSSEQILITEFKLGSSKLSLEFLPCNNPTTTATFKDLMLCTSDQVGSRVYYIANPLTKQWVALPSCPLDKRQQKWIKRPILICELTYNHTRDYKFRVVLVRHPPCQFKLHKFDLVVYCSEIGEWKVINLRIPMEAGPLEEYWDKERDVCFNMFIVCNGIIYFKSGLCLVALDPFDVNASSGTTLEARAMPRLPRFGYLQESSGQLLVVLSGGSREGLPWYMGGKKHGRDMELQMVVWKLDPNQAPLEWEMSFQGLCKGSWYSKLPPLTHYIIYASDIGVHPYNDKLIYMHLTSEQRLVLCDTGTRCITPLKSLPYDYVSRFERLELQWWPTSVPALVHAMPHTKAELATATIEVW